MIKDLYLSTLKLNTKYNNIKVDENRLCNNKECPHIRFYDTKKNKVIKIHDKSFKNAYIGHFFCLKFNHILITANSGTDFVKSLTNCGGKTITNFYNENNPLLVREKIEDKLEKISKIEIEIEKLIKYRYPNYNFELELGDFLWECDLSPIGTCLYNKFEDKLHDNCIFCGQPEERK